MINIILPRYRFGTALRIFPPHKSEFKQQHQKPDYSHRDHPLAAYDNDKYNLALLNAAVHHPAFPQHRLLTVEILMNGIQVHCCQINPNPLSLTGHYHPMRLIYNKNTASYAAWVDGQILTPPMDGNSLVNALLLVLGDRAGARICGLDVIYKQEFAAYPDEVIRAFRQSVLNKEKSE
ncbi:MAG: hypothetical protein ACRC5A_00795 [Enterobacteriaceae bacterium]